jgi:hypothetical protein
MSETCPGRSADGSGPARPAPEVALLASLRWTAAIDRRGRAPRWATRSIVMSPNPRARAPKQGRIARTLRHPSNRGNTP